MRTSGPVPSSPQPDTGSSCAFSGFAHDTHDWDAAQTPVLIDGVIDGRPRRLLAQANRNGHFFVLDRTNGQHILTTTHIESVNWTKGLNAKGQPIPNPAKEASIAGVLVSPDTNGATNWPPPSFNPDTGLFYVGTAQTFSVFYLTDTDERPQGWAAAERGIGSLGRSLKAIDYKTGKVKWSHPMADAGRRRGRGTDGSAQHGGQTAVRQRWWRQLRGVRSFDG